MVSYVGWLPLFSAYRLWLNNIVSMGLIFKPSSDFQTRYLHQLYAKTNVRKNI